MNVIKAVLFIILVNMPIHAFATMLTESSVNHFLTQIQQSVNAKNADKLSHYFTDDVSITIELPEHMGGTSTIDKTEYTAMLKQGWALPASYTYEVKDIVIAIAKDKKSAVVTDVTIENISIGEQTLSSTSYETLNIIATNGNIMINNIIIKVAL